MGYIHRKLYEGPVSGLYGKPTPYYRYPYDGSEEDDSTIAVVMFTTDDKASFLVRRKVTGVSKNNIPWSRWQDLGKLFLSVKANSKGVKSLNAYGTYRTGRKWTMFKNVTASPGEIRTIVPREFIDEVNSEAQRLVRTYMPESLVPEILDSEKISSYPNEPFNNVVYTAYEYIPRLVYPMLRTRKFPFDSGNATGKSFGARAYTEMEYTKSLFGKRNYRKDLVKAVAETDMISCIFFARAFRNHVPADWLVTFLQKSNDIKGFPELSKTHLESMRKILPFISLTNRRRLLTELTKPHKMAVTQERNERAGRGRRNRRNMPPSYYVQDALSFAATIPPAAVAGLDASGWKELHDGIIAIDDRQKHGNVEIPETPLAKKIATLPMSDEFAIILPEDTEELRMWGRTMKHCIGSYASYAVAGKQVFFAIMKDGEMIGNAQIDPAAKRCIQILGKRNAHLPSEDVKLVSSMFEKHDILPKSAFKDALGVR